ncbi:MULTISPECIES: type II secretion system secretin GspD [unclassified Sphingomonas]|uniref:type II secretion system secretin GspD n=1 Tax=unclassified Sphingomonas TaxID=196159 RepID=UPI000835171F|nr:MULTISPECIES: type II secretion system secretin GspD [unclassified Sphingomonas]
MRQPIRSAIAALTLSAVALQPVLAQTAAEPRDIVVNMRGVEIADVADQISRITGRTLILDPNVKGLVTVTSADPLTATGAWELFLSVLRANGFAAVRSGRAWRIVPQANAIRDGGVPSRSSGGQELVTRMIRLANVSSADAARVVRPLVASFGSVEPLTSPNAIVVTDYADNVRRVEQVARSLDGGGGSTFTTILLKNGDAAQVAESLQGVLGEGNGAGTTRIAADARSNTVIVRGTPSAVAEARRIAQVLDAPGGATPRTRLFRLNYADAESVTEILRGVLGIDAEATNPVARSLQGGAGRVNRPSAAVSNLIARNSAAQAALGDAVGDGEGGSQGGSVTLPSESGGGRAATPAGFSTPSLTVQPAPEINGIVVRGTPAAIASVEGIIADLDVRRPQVLIEAAIAEITGDDAEQLAIQLGTSGAVLDQVEGAATSFSNTGSPSLGGILTALGVPAGALLGSGLTGNVAFGNDFSILVQALGTSEKANLLSTPQIMALDNEVGEITVGQEVPFVTGSILTEGANVNPFTTIERRDVGIKLRILPRVNAGDTIQLEVAQEASSIAPVQVQNATDLITNRRSITTKVLADNGSTIVLGGLISDDERSSRSQVPVLGDIPLLGELFKARRESRTKRSLFIFLKPTIIRDGADATTAAQSRYDRLRRDEAELTKRESLLIRRKAPRLTLEIDGIY